MSSMMAPSWQELATSPDWEAARRQALALLRAAAHGQNAPPSSTEDRVSTALARRLAFDAGGLPSLQRLLHSEALRAASARTGDLEAAAIQVGLRLKRSRGAWRVPFMDYLRAAPAEPGWHLVEHGVAGGWVHLTEPEARRLVAEAEGLRILRSHHDETPDPGGPLRDILESLGDDLRLLAPPRTTPQGPAEVQRFPPCMRRLHDNVHAGEPVRHEARFALVAFLHGAGMDREAILDLFHVRSDFDASETAYQVRHITGDGGTPYSPPSCATLQLEGLCPLQERDRLCRAVRHPLGYYRARHPEAPP
jgi:DNA primase large subunit